MLKTEKICSNHSFFSCSFWLDLTSELILLLAFIVSMSQKGDFKIIVSLFYNYHAMQHKKKTFFCHENNQYWQQARKLKVLYGTWT